MTGGVIMVEPIPCAPDGCGPVQALSQRVTDLDKRVTSQESDISRIFERFYQGAQKHIDELNTNRMLLITASISALGLIVTVIGMFYRR
jgi:hypothetical protein